MNLKAGTFIKSTKALSTTYFEDVVIFITEHNEKGAMGFVISRPFNRSLNELQEFRDASGFPIFEGGPVDQEHLYFLHIRPDVIEEGSPLGNGIYLGGNFRQAVDAITDGTISRNQVKLFVGYCGWDKNELEAEIGEGSWEVIEGSNKDIFKTA